MTKLPQLGPGAARSSVDLRRPSFASPQSRARCAFYELLQDVQSVSPEECRVLRGRSAPEPLVRHGDERGVRHGSIEIETIERTSGVSGLRESSLQWLYAMRRPGSDARTVPWSW